MQSLHRKLFIVLFLLLPTLLAASTPTPQRLALLRGAIALAEGDPAARGDVQPAAEMAAEDWRAQMLYGEALALAGEPVLARGQLRLAALLAPWRPEPWQTMARVGRSLGDTSLEYAGLAGLLRVFPTDPAAQCRLAALYRQLGRTAEADTVDAGWRAALPPLQLDAVYTIQGHPATLEELRQLAQTDTVDATVWPALATGEWRAKNGEAACAAARQAYQLAPNDLTAIRNYAHLCLLLGHTDEALRVLRAAPVGDEALERNLAYWDISTGQYSEAIPVLHRLLVRMPTDVTLNRLLGAVSLLEGDTDTAVAALREAWYAQPDHLTAQSYVIALLAAGRKDDAEFIINRAMQKFPEETMLRVIQAQLYQETGRWEQAAETTAQTAAQRPEAVELLLLAGERYITASRYTRAAMVARRLRDQYPTDLFAMHGAIRLFRLLYATSDASLVLTRYFGPNFPGPLTKSALLLTTARYAIEDQWFVEASAALEEIFKVTPNDPEANRLLGTLYEQQRNWPAAVQIYRTAHAAWPQDAGFTLALARAAWQSGNLPLAIDTYREATTLTAQAEPWLALGDIAAAQGDAQRARECWTTAATHPDGAWRARLQLLLLDEPTQPPAVTATHLTDYMQQLSAERTARATRWQQELATRSLDATVEELDALLLLAPDLPDPTPLQQRLQQLQTP